MIDAVNAACLRLIGALQARSDAPVELSLRDWDGAIRRFRQARLTGWLFHSLVRCGTLASVQEQVRGHLLAARNFAAFRRHALEVELDAALAAIPADVEVVLLKGAAYLAQELPFSAGRLPSDVDLMVARANLDSVEQSLGAAGWSFGALTDYDQRYYREWSHELPPMTRKGGLMEVDLHHAITPVTARTRIDSASLFARAQPVAGQRFKVLHPEDQIIHAAIHLFQDSELDGRLRDLVDIDGLVRAFLDTDEKWLSFSKRVHELGADEPVWYALHFGAKWMGTPRCDLPELSLPGALRLRAMEWIVPRTCLPTDLDNGPTFSQRMARRIATARYHLLRMPPGLLARHVVHKAADAVRAWRKPAVKTPAR
jgi:hypothetical protein